jgi:hypothetical protein
MLKIKDNVLFYDNEVIKTSDVIFKLKTDKEANYLGHITLNNGIKLTFPFVNEGLIYKGKFTISKDILPFLKGSFLSLTMMDLTFKKNTNQVEIVFDTVSINLNIKKEVGEEFKLLSIKVAELESQLLKLSNKGILKNAPVINKDDIKEGMVPVATSTGEFTAAYPFADIVKNINGVGAINEAILLTLAEIPYEPNGRSTKEVVQLILEIVKGQAEVIQTILKTQEKIIQDIKDIKLDFAEHKNTALF